jgi:fluoride exporter
MRILLYIGTAGFFGATARYMLAGFVQRSFSDILPYGTLTVNVIGSLLLAFIMEFSGRSILIPDDIRIPLTVGFFGAFTTFSTFSYETFRLFEEGSILLAFTNIILNVVVCLFFIWVGFIIARAI